MLEALDLLDARLPTTLQPSSAGRNS